MITIYADVLTEKLDRLEARLAALREAPQGPGDRIARLEAEAGRLRAVLDDIGTDGLAA